MTLSGKKYLTAIVVIIVYIEEVGALIATLCKYAWSNSPKKGWYILFLKELHVATVATATIIIRRRTTLGPCSPTLRKLFVFCNHNSDTLV